MRDSIYLFYIIICDRRVHRVIEGRSTAKLAYTCLFKSTFQRLKTVNISSHGSSSVFCWPLFYFIPILFIYFCHKYGSNQI